MAEIFSGECRKLMPLMPTRHVPFAKRKPPSRHIDVDLKGLVIWTVMLLLLFQMSRLMALGLLALSVAFVLAADEDITAELQRQKKVDEDITNELQKQKNIISDLTRQIMMQQLVYEESNRASWDSGVKSVRGALTGTRPYFAGTHTGKGSVYAIHDHSQNTRTVGFGEMVVMLNGVEFRTRHNDFKIVKAIEDNNKFQATEDIPWPDVPTSVTEKETVQEQVDEMRKYFKAFKKQVHNDVDYRPYFKPVLCYLEGYWMGSTEKIDEPFESDRHKIDATTWWDLTEKVRYTGYTGRKSNKENYSFLPMKIMNLKNNNTEPEFAQWNYRILCAPIEENLPTSKLRIVDDLPRRMSVSKTLEEMADTRYARFFLSDLNNMNKEKSFRKGLLDKFMETIPGLDNYGCNLSDPSFGSTAAVLDHPETVLNSCYYHRNFQGKKGAMGLVRRRRGFNDQNIFMAQTTQEKIPPVAVNDCESGDTCVRYEQRWSYAIPLEIIYLTPLYKWNPWNIKFHERKTPGFDGVNANGRNGGNTTETAYDGVRYNIFYITPEEFFQGAGEPDPDPADTSKGTVGVLDQEGVVRNVMASGTRIFLPDLPDIGKIRLRYPVAPVHSDGSTIWKELQVLKDIVLRGDLYSHMLRY